MKFILGKKIGMVQMIDESGKTTPVTLIEAGPCVVTQIKTEEKDKYQAIQIGFQEIKKEKKIKKPMKNKPFFYLREFKNENNEYKVGDKIEISIFNEGDKIKVSGVSKGKGFQGGVKRWGFSGRGASHGVKHEARTIGSVGCSFPERVVKGRKMPGRMGADRRTVKNLKIIKIDKEKNLLAIKGAVPGQKQALLEIKG